MGCGQDISHDNLVMAFTKEGIDKGTWHFKVFSQCICKLNLSF